MKNAFRKITPFATAGLLLSMIALSPVMANASQSATEMIESYESANSGEASKHSSDDMTVNQSVITDSELTDRLDEIDPHYLSGNYSVSLLPLSNESREGKTYTTFAVKADLPNNCSNPSLDEVVSNTVEKIDECVWFASFANSGFDENLNRNKTSSWKDSSFVTTNGYSLVEVVAPEESVNRSAVFSTLANDEMERATFNLVTGDVDRK